MSQLQANNLVKTYGRRTVVRGVSLTVSQGESVGIVGANGAGKTTTFYMMVGLVKPTSGTVLLDDSDITREPMYVRARKGLGYLAQENSVFRRLTAEQNIQLVLEGALDREGKRIGKAEQNRRLETLLTDLGLQERRHSQAAVLSGGERRRVEIARALATEPQFILLDEPFTGVDPLAIGDLRTVINGLKARGIGVLITDHNVSALLAITDRAYVVSDGEIKTHGPSATLWDDPIARQFYLGNDTDLLGGPQHSRRVFDEDDDDSDDENGDAES